MIDIDPEIMSRMIAGIYEAAYDQSAWSNAVVSLCNLFHGSKACLARMGPDLSPYDTISTNNDPKFDQLFIEEHAGHPNVLADAVFSAPVGMVYSDHALVGPEKFRRSRFWNDWMAPQDMYGGIASKLLVSGPSMWFFDVQRGRNQTAFAEKDAELLEIFVPHLARATDISRQLKSTQTLASAFLYLPFGVILVDRYMRIHTANPAADTIFAHPRSPLLSRSGQLNATDPETMATLRNLVAQTCRSEDDIIPGTGGDLLIRSKRRGDPDLSLSVGPLARTSPDNDPFHERCAAIFVREIILDLPQGFEEQVRTLFGLTAREASLSASLASGRSMRETAEDTHVAYSTLRTHLDNVFRKTGTRQQSQLVALLRSLQPPMRR